MSPNAQDLATRAVEVFNMNGGSYKDYVLVADITPPRIVRTSPGIGLLVLEDQDLQEVCRQVLIINKAPIFRNFDEFKKAYGMHHNRENGWLAYESPSGFYTVEHPGIWRIKREENILNIYPPDGDGAVTISAFYEIPPTALKGLIERTFKNYQIVSPLNAISRNNWEGFHCELTQTTDTGFRSWLVIGAYYKKVSVFISANDTQESMPLQRAIYEYILDSITLADPEETGA